ncbi:hypothetical protein Cch01nite_13860 [Cellulomonas chitinilytica]|uniref:YcxB-like protein domain-containing protein n=1 Tax=Cellulomonas chitinilytica TaxID=398759 RepID=A0A919U1M9_9CELL|nr:hypothetical protein [Cellulomonas chitinilytica]GIG20662.1 hypothetical protein Cch01nite_13860 [Cellulomonas chitinilytica]
MEPDVRSERTAVVGAGFARRAARLFAVELLRGARLAGVGLLLVATGLLWMGQLALIVGLVLGIVLGLYFLERRTRTQLAGQAPVGSCYRARCDDEGLWVSGPTGESTTFYAALEGIAVRGDVALVRMRSSSVRRFMPAELFSGGRLAELDALIAAARPAR